MTFTTDQVELLLTPLDPGHVKKRQGPRGMQLSYIEGYQAIRTANDIFGFDGWSYEIQMLQPVEGGMIAHVRLRVGDVVREDVGFGDGNEELAHKEAVTDALKRALRTFGDPFGLDLYDKESPLHRGGGQASRQPPPPRQQAAPRQNAPAPENKAPAPSQTPTEDLGTCTEHGVPWVRSTRTGKVGHANDDGTACLRPEEPAGEKPHVDSTTTLLMWAQHHLGIKPQELAADLGAETVGGIGGIVTETYAGDWGLVKQRLREIHQPQEQEVAR